MIAAHNAISADRAFVRRLGSDRFDARVHSIFHRIVNLYCAADDRLYSIAAARCDNAPCTIVTDAASFDRLDLRCGAPASMVGDRLFVGSGLVISLDRIQPWSGELPTLTRARIPLRWGEELIASAGVGGGVKARTPQATPIERETSRLLGEFRRGLQEALCAGALESAYRYGSRLIGLGPGLTPAGDDYIVGLATACAMRGDPARSRQRVLRRVVDENAHRTNQISHATLTHAARGRVAESIVGFARAVADGDTDAMTRRARRVIAIGATSGTDIMIGLLSGLDLDEAGCEARAC